MENEVQQIEKPVSDNILTEQFIFSDEIHRVMEEERNKCIRSILWTAEVIWGDKKQSEDFSKLRKSVLDSVNDFYRKFEIVTSRAI